MNGKTVSGSKATSSVVWSCPLVFADSPLNVERGLVPVPEAEKGPPGPVIVNCHETTSEALRFPIVPSA